MKVPGSPIDYDKLFEEIGWDKWGDKKGSIIEPCNKGLAANAGEGISFQIEQDQSDS